MTTRAIATATGSVPAPLPIAETESSEGVVVDSTGAFSFDEVPGRLAVISGGAHRLELGSVWRRLGTSVAVVEHMDRILPGTDGRNGGGDQYYADGTAFIGVSNSIIVVVEEHFVRRSASSPNYPIISRKDRKRGVLHVCGGHRLIWRSIHRADEKHA